MGMVIKFIFSHFIIAVQKENQCLPKGLLIVESFSWKNLAPGQLLLKIHTYATKAATINLPPGYVPLYNIFSVQ